MQFPGSFHYPLPSDSSLQYQEAGPPQNPFCTQNSIYESQRLFHQYLFSLWKPAILSFHRHYNQNPTAAEIPRYYYNNTADMELDSTVYSCCIHPYLDLFSCCVDDGQVLVSSLSALRRDKYARRLTQELHGQDESKIYGENFPSGKNQARTNSHRPATTVGPHEEPTQKPCILPALSYTEYILSGHTNVVSEHLFSMSHDEISYSSSVDKSVRVWRRDECINCLRLPDWGRTLRLSPQTESILVGSVNGLITMYDQNAGCIRFSFHINDSYNPKDKIIQAGSPHWMNSIGSIGFMKQNCSEHIFLAGYRDGRVRMYDTRTISGTSNGLQQQHVAPEQNKQIEVLSLVAHGTREDVTKINHCEFLSDNVHFITAGRDSTIRLFDLRMISNGMVHTECTLKEWNQHKCDSYKLNTILVEDERTIVTGSEDGDIVLYDLTNESKCHRMPFHSSPVHDFDVRRGIMISACMDSSDAVLWEPDLFKENPAPLTKQKVSGQVFREQWLFDHLVDRYGDQIFSNYLLPTSQASNRTTLMLDLDFVQDLCRKADENDVLTEEDKEYFRDLLREVEHNGELALPHLMEDFA